MALSYQHLFNDCFTFAAYKKFLARRLARIYPVYFIATLIAFITIILGFDTATKADVSTPIIWLLKLIINLSLFQTWGIANSLDPNAWSLSAEWSAYIFFPILFTVCCLKNTKFVIAVASVCVIFLYSLLSPHVFHQSNLKFPYDLTNYHMAVPLLRCIPEFCLGLIAFRFRACALVVKLQEVSFVAPVLLSLILIMLFIPRCDFFFVLLLPLTILTLSGKPNNIAIKILSSPLALFFGAISYSLYLIHPLLYPVLHFVREIAVQYGLNHSQSYALAIFLPLTVFCSYVSYQYLEVPARNRLRNIFEGSRQLVAVKPSNI